MRVCTERRAAAAQDGNVTNDGRARSAASAVTERGGREAWQMEEETRKRVRVRNIGQKKVSGASRSAILHTGLGYNTFSCVVW